MPSPTQANPGPLGLVAFGVTTLLLSFVNAKVLPAGGEAVVLPLAFAFGGSTQFAAGLLEFKTGNTFGMTAFMSYGAFWIWFALLLFLNGAGVLNLSMAGPTVGVALLMWGALSFGFWISTFRFHFCLWLTFLLLVVTFVLLGLGGRAPQPDPQNGRWLDGPLHGRAGLLHRHSDPGQRGLRL